MAGSVVSLAEERSRRDNAIRGEDGVALDTYKRLFQESRDLTQSAREMAKKHRRYYDGKIDEKLRRELRRKRQPDFTVNAVRRGIEGLIGVVEKGATDPRAWPRTPQDEAASEVATDTLRYVADVNRWPQNKSKVFRNMLVEGVAAVLIEVDEQLEVQLQRIRYEEFFYDPYSREPDFSDASYMGCAKWQYVDEIIAAYPEHEAQLRLAVSQGDFVDANWNDRPESASTMWTDPKRKRMLRVEMYRRERGEWYKCAFVGSIKLEEGPSPYQDNDGKPCNPIEAQTIFVDDENQRYSVVADMIGPQDEINVYRRRAAHRATFRQVQETDAISAYADPEEVRREASRPDGVIPPGYAIVPDDKFSLDMTLLQEAKGEIERIGPSPEVLGRQSASASGRAQLIRQQAGLTELAHLFSALDDLELRIYRQVWARVRQFWKAPKFIRVTDDENAVRFVQINEPVQGPPQPVIDPVTGMPKYDPMTRQIVMETPIVGMRNEVAKMGVDIIVDSTPDTANVAQEQFQALIDLAPIMAQSGQPIPWKAIFKASSLPKKRELLDELEKGGQPQGPSPEQQMAQRIAMEKAAADIDKTRAQADQAKASALKTMSDARMTEMQAMQPPEPPVGQGF